MRFLATVSLTSATAAAAAAAVVLGLHRGALAAPTYDERDDGHGHGHSHHAAHTHLDVSSRAASRDARLLRPDLIGYSIEPTALADFTSNRLTRDLLDLIKSAAGGQTAPVRIGGNTADQIVISNDTAGVDDPTHLTSTGTTNDDISTIDPAWYDLWTGYFGKDTDLVYTLNFRNTTDGWATAQQQFQLVLDSAAKQGGHIDRIEFGNEIDHYINKKWRDQGWDVASYIPQWRQLRTAVKSLPQYKQYKPKFQAAVFADPPEVPDQQDEIDDFSIANLTKAGFTNDQHDISGYAVHLYPQSTCDAPRKARLSLDLLVDHSVIHRNLSQFIPQEQAARTQGNAPLLLGETNSASCSGQSGISDVFGAALWMVDYSLTAASFGIEQVFYHLGNKSPYSAFVPTAFTSTDGEQLQAGVRANFYSHWFLARVVAGKSSLSVKAIEGGASRDFSSFAVYSQKHLEKLVLVDLGHWNSTRGTHNPSTQSSTDSKSASSGKRPVRTVDVSTPWKRGTQLQVTRLQGPGINAKSLVTVDGQSVSASEQGAGVHGKQSIETARVEKGGRVSIEMQQAEAVLISRS